MAEDVVDVEPSGASHCDAREVLRAAGQVPLSFASTIRTLFDGWATPSAASAVATDLVLPSVAKLSTTTIFCSEARSESAERGAPSSSPCAACCTRSSRGLGPNDRATTDQVRRLTAALAGLAGALLLPHLLRRAADLAEALGRGGAGAALRELPLHDLPQEVLVDLGAEHGVVEVDRADASCR